MFTPPWCEEKAKEQGVWDSTLFDSKDGTDGTDGGNSSSSTMEKYARTGESRDQFLKRIVDRALQSGRMTAEQAGEFWELFGEHPEYNEAVDFAQRAIGDQDLAKLTNQQKQMLSERISKKFSAVGAKNSARLQEEEQAMKRFNEEGKPSGHQFWFEYPELCDFGLPPELKDEMYEEVKGSRKPGSAANRPPDDSDGSPMMDVTDLPDPPS